MISGDAAAVHQAVGGRTRLVSEVESKIYVTTHKTRITAFQSLQSALPAVPPSTKLSKLDVLLMASAYIAHLGRLVQQQIQNDEEDHQQINSNSNSRATFHPVKKWPMRARLYAELNDSSSHRPSAVDQHQTKVYRHHHSGDNQPLL
uniref:BHLH domain-containing protein n=1 Tax=Daphnia galeata TaxID=27404 RepID=A0A8J2WCN0_9CRUS|nr:unnamed protein product [Daphnia galeata]